MKKKPIRVHVELTGLFRNIRAWFIEQKLKHHIRKLMACVGGITEVEALDMLDKLLKKNGYETTRDTCNGATYHKKQ
jgi:hypothetical protein